MVPALGHYAAPFACAASDWEAPLAQGNFIRPLVRVRDSAFVLLLGAIITQTGNYKHAILFLPTETTRGYGHARPLVRVRDSAFVLPLEAIITPIGYYKHAVLSVPTETTRSYCHAFHHS